MRIVPIPGRGRRCARALAAAVVCALAACGSGEGAQGGAGRLRVVAGLHPLAEVAERVGGERVDVVDLTPSGAEPHDLELLPDQVELLEDADLVVVLGRGFQPAVEDVADRRGDATLFVLDELAVPEGAVADDHGEGAGGHGGDEGAAAHGEGAEGDAGHEEGAADQDARAAAHDEGAEGDAGHEEGAADGDAEAEVDADHGGGVDPHVWLDPTLMADVVDHVADALADLEPDGAAGFEAAAAAYREELASLDAAYRDALAPCRGATIVVAHEAFGWLAARYGLVQEGISGLAPGAEPSPARLAELADLVREEGVTTVFTETLVSPEVAEALAREAGVGTAVLNPLEGLTDEERAAGATYVSVMEDNLSTLVDALPCAQPA